MSRIAALLIKAARRSGSRKLKKMIYKAVGRHKVKLEARKEAGDEQDKKNSQE